MDKKIEFAANTDTEISERGHFLKNHKRVVIVISLLLVIGIAIYFFCAVSNSKKEQQVRDYLNGKILINCYKPFSDYQHVYSFTEDKVAIEYWDKKNGAPEGNLSNYTTYEVSVTGDYVDISFNDEHVNWKWNGRGTLMDPVYDRLFNYDSAEIDVDRKRKDFFCDHEFDVLVITPTTCTTAGEEERTCKKCGLHETVQPIPQHSYESNQCTFCGVLKKSDISADTWYTHKVIDVLQVQNCQIESVTLSGNVVVTSYYIVCSHCHGIDGCLQVSFPELGHIVSTLHKCDECGKTTTAKLKVES